MKTCRDIGILRQLAEQVAKISRDPIQERKRALWRQHNSLQRPRPVLLCLPEMSWSQLVPESAILCNDPLYRTYEWSFRRIIYRWQNIPDDYVIEPEVRVPIVFSNSGYRLNGQTAVAADKSDPSEQFAYNDNILYLINILGEYRDPFGSNNGTGHRAEPVLQEPSDLDNLQIPEITIDEPKTTENLQMLEDAVGDILPVVKVGFTFINCSLAGDFIALRGMEQMMLDVYDRPKWLHRAIALMTDAVQFQIDQLQNNGLLSHNSDGAFAVSSLGYTSELPTGGLESKSPRAIDLWGQATVQSASFLSPGHQEEYFIQYQRRLLANFGLNQYGCCEPLNSGNLEYIKAIPRLRKIVVSPWSDLDSVKQHLGHAYAIAFKPNPTQITSVFDIERSKRELEGVLEMFDGCALEIVLKDIGTVSGNPDRLRRYCQMASGLIGAN